MVVRFHRPQSGRCGGVVILDRIERWPRYFADAPWRRAFEFLARLDARAAEGTYEIEGQDIYARVIVYQTLNETAAILESHRQYVDIQAALEGSERIAWFPLEGLRPEAPYDNAKDAIFYEHQAQAGGEAILEPGRFAVFFPSDAHMPQLVVGEPQVMKKVVIKVRHR